MRTSFNINDEVGVRLTPQALEYLRREHVEFWERVGKPSPYPYREPTVDSNGICWFQLWALADRFGPVLTPGNPPMFEDALLYLNIETETDTPTIIQTEAIV